MAKRRNCTVSAKPDPNEESIPCSAQLYGGQLIGGAAIRQGPKEGRKKRRSFWHVEPADYGTACEIGAEYGAHFIEYIKGHHGTFGCDLACIAREINFNDKSTAGIWVGFFGQLERRICLTAEFVNPYDLLDRQRAFYVACAQRYEEDKARTRRSLAAMRRRYAGAQQDAAFKAFVQGLIGNQDAGGAR